MKNKSATTCKKIAKKAKKNYGFYLQRTSKNQRAVSAASARFWNYDYDNSDGDNDDGPSLRAMVVTMMPPMSMLQAQSSQWVITGGHGLSADLSHHCL